MTRTQQSCKWLFDNVKQNRSIASTPQYWYPFITNMGNNLGWISLGMSWFFSSCTTSPNCFSSLSLSVFADNEPDLWHHTHYDIHPSPVTYDELWTKTQTFAAGLKSQFPDLITFGPALSSWCALMYLPGDGCAPGYSLTLFNNSAHLSLSSRNCVLRRDRLTAIYQIRLSQSPK